MNGSIYSCASKVSKKVDKFGRNTSQRKTMTTVTRPDKMNKVVDDIIKNTYSFGHNETLDCGDGEKSKFTEKIILFFVCFWYSFATLKNTSLIPGLVFSLGCQLPKNCVFIKILVHSTILGWHNEGHLILKFCPICIYEMAIIICKTDVMCNECDYDLKLDFTMGILL